jgi:hypothetical protein
MCEYVFLRSWVGGGCQLIVPIVLYARSLSVKPRCCAEVQLNISCVRSLFLTRLCDWLFLVGVL